MKNIQFLIKQKHIFPFFILLFSIPVILPYFHQGFFPTHDGEWAVVRLTDMYRELKDLQIPPRYSGNLNFGYGYPLFNFAYPFPYYLGFILHLFHFGFVDSIKILFALSVPLSAIFMYLLSKEIWKNSFAGFISSLLYIYLPYRFVDLYVRGSIGESLSFILFPLIIYSLLRLVKKPSSYLFIIILAFSLAALIMTHNIMTVLFVPFFLTFLAFILHKKGKIEKISTFFALFIGVMLAAFFWLPALAEKGNILLSKIPIADRNLYFVTLNQFIFPKWGYGTPTEVNGFSYQLGYPHLFIFIFAILLFVYLYRKKVNLKDNNDIIKIGLLLILLIFLYSLMLFNFTAIIWQIVPLLREINYPWTLLAMLGFMVSLLAGFLTIKKYTTYVGIILAIIAIVVFLPYARPYMYVDRDDNFYLTNDATTTSSSELMPLWVKNFPSERPKEKIEVVNGANNIIKSSYNSKSFIFYPPTIKDEIVVRINTIYYPGWKAYFDGKEAKIIHDNDKGVMLLNIPKGVKKVELYFKETSLRIIADLITVSGFVLLSIYIVFSPRIITKIK